MLTNIDIDQKKIEELSVISTLRIIEHVYIQLDKPHKAQEITDFIKQIQSDAENFVAQTEK